MATKVDRDGWKSGEQLEFLLFHDASFKLCQDAKKLDQFWQRTFEEWYRRWPLPPPDRTVPEKERSGALLLARKEKNAQIKSWFNNRGRGTGKIRGDLKLDIKEGRKLAALQAYCSYEWSTLRPEVLARWEQQKKTTTFSDEDDPPEVTDVSNTEACIPIAFKLNVVKSFFDKLSKEEKKEIDRRREEDRNRLHRKLSQITNEEDRIEKLQTHQRNQQLISGSVTRVLSNLEIQAGCVVQLIVGYVDPSGGPPQIEQFCQGRTPGGLDFETFYGEDWEKNIENKFTQWALRVFGDKGSAERERFLFPKGPPAPSQALTSGLPASQGPVSEDSSPAPATSPRDLSTPAPPLQKSASRPATSKKSTPRTVAPRKPRESLSQSSTSTGSAFQPSTSHSSLPVNTPQVTPSPANTSSQVTSLPVNISSQVAVASDLPLADPFPPVDTSSANYDATLLVTALGVRHILSQAANNSQLSHASHASTLETPAVVEPLQFTGDQSQHSVPPPQVAVNPYQFTVDESLLYSPPSQDVVEPSQSNIGSLQSAVQPLPKSTHESSQAVPMDTQPDSAVISTPPYTGAANALKVSYRSQNPSNVISGRHSRQDSIEGAPGMVFGLHMNSEVQDSSNDDEPEITVDLSDYVNLDGDGDGDDETHVSSSQKTMDGSQEPPLASPTRTHPQLDVDEDLPAWMLKRNQWKYIVSTTGGPNWENLLRLYIQQERRLEFTDMGSALGHENRPSKIKEYFQYAHNPSRGDTLTVPDFGTEVSKWWERLQPEWRRSNRDSSPPDPTQWSYILSGGSKGVFLVIMCLAWWDRAHARHLEKERVARRINADAAGISPNFDDLPDHDPEWLNIVNDVAFVMKQAQGCSVPTRGAPSPSHRTKRKREVEPSASRKKPAVKTGPLKTRSKA